MLFVTKSLIAAGQEILFADKIGSVLPSVLLSVVTLSSKETIDQVEFIIGPSKVILVEVPPK
jgi:hypothetical protein